MPALPLAIEYAEWSKPTLLPAGRYEVIHATAEHGCAESACADRMQPMSMRSVAAALTMLQAQLPEPHARCTRVRVQRMCTRLRALPLDGLASIGARASVVLRGAHAEAAQSHP